MWLDDRGAFTPLLPPYRKFAGAQTSLSWIAWPWHLFLSNSIYYVKTPNTLEPHAGSEDTEPLRCTIPAEVIDVNEGNTLDRLHCICLIPLLSITKAEPLLNVMYSVRMIIARKGQLVHFTSLALVLWRQNNVWMVSSNRFIKLT